MYAIRILDSAVKDLKGIDKSIARNILARINWLAENFDVVDHKALKGELAGLYKFRTGDYRVIYEILEKEKNIVVHSVGHRREVYKKR